MWWHNILNDGAAPSQVDVSRAEAMPHELEIISAVVAGYTDGEIGEYLKIAEGMVEHHLSTAFEKLGVSTRLELALFAVNQGGYHYQSFLRVQLGWAYPLPPQKAGERATAEARMDISEAWRKFGLTLREWSPGPAW